MFGLFRKPVSSVELLRPGLRALIAQGTTATEAVAACIEVLPLSIADAALLLAEAQELEAMKKEMENA